MNDLRIQILTETEWDLFDLRNMARYSAQSELSLIGYIKGLAYQPEIIRVFCEETDVDLVYAINSPCISSRPHPTNFSEKLFELKKLCIGEVGPYITLCFNDLVLAIRYPEDTAFFCYRAIESLRNHNAIVMGIEDRSDSQKWIIFRETSGVERSAIDRISVDARHIRHGNEILAKRTDRETILITAWDIVDAYVSVASSRLLSDGIQKSNVTETEPNK